MGRKTIELDIEKLKATILEVEAAGPLANLSALYKQVSDIMVSKGEAHCNPQLVMLRIQKLGLPVKTQKGKKGRQPGQKVDMGSIGNRQRRSMQEEVYEALLKSGPVGGKGQIPKSAYRKQVNRAKGGSLKAAIRLKCLECADYQREEIRMCGCLNCPLYSIRPFKTSQEKTIVKQESDFIPTRPLYD